MKTSPKAGLFCAMILLQGCAKAPERTLSHTPKQATMNNLKCLAVTIWDMSLRNELFNKNATPETLLDELISRKHLSPDEASALTMDCWGNPVQISISTDERLISLISAGPNELFEDGKGDDIRVEIRLARGQSPVIFHRWLLDNGQEHYFFTKDPQESRKKRKD